MAMSPSNKRLLIWIAVALVWLGMSTVYPVVGIVVNVLGVAFIVWLLVSAKLRDAVWKLGRREPPTRPAWTSGLAVIAVAVIGFGVGVSQILERAREAERREIAKAEQAEEKKRQEELSQNRFKWVQQKKRDTGRVEKSLPKTAGEPEKKRFGPESCWKLLADADSLESFYQRIRTRRYRPTKRNCQSITSDLTSRFSPDWFKSTGVALSAEAGEPRAAEAARTFAATCTEITLAFACDTPAKLRNEYGPQIVEDYDRDFWRFVKELRTECMDVIKRGKPVPLSDPKVIQSEAKGIYKSLQGLERKGRRMAPLRRTKRRDKLERCGKLMREYQPQAELLRLRAERLPIEIGLHLSTAAASTMSCVSCLANAEKDCKTAQGALGKAKEVLRR